MPLLERYVMRRILRSTAVCFAVLIAMFWATESLDQVDVVTSKGQSIWTFQVIAFLALTQVAEILAPIAFLIGLVATLGRMNSDSELAVIMASGAGRRRILVPVLAAAGLLAILVGFMSAFVTPGSLTAMRDLLYRVRADLINEAVRDGGFRSLDGDDLVIHIREKAADGSFRGVFINDVRDAEEPLQYFAGRAALIEEAERAFLILVDGTVIRSEPGGAAAEIVDFRTHAIDLSQFVRAGARRTASIAEHTLIELVDPDPDDPEFQRRPERFVTELHKRLSLPLYPFAFAAIALAGLARPRSGRHDHIAAMVTVVVLSVALIFVGFSVLATAEVGRVGWHAIYLAPAVALAAGFAALSLGMRLATPYWIRTAVGSVSALLSRFQTTAAERRVGGEA